MNRELVSFTQGLTKMAHFVVALRKISFSVPLVRLTLFYLYF